MKLDFKPRVRAFLARVQKNEAAAVAEDFVHRLDAATNPNTVNLFVLLEEARRTGAGNKESALRSQADVTRLVRHCCS
jgi:hypothetical protein